MSKIKISTLYLLFLVVDLLIFPRFLFSTPITIFFLPFVVFLSPDFRHSNAIVFLSFLVVVFSSVFCSVFVYPNYVSENIKRAIQIGFVFMFLIFNFNKIDFDFIFKGVRWFLVFYYSLVLVFIYFFFFNSELYYSFMMSIFPESIPMLSVNIESQRFSFHFTDPNSFGYMVVITLAFLLSLKLRTGEHVFYIVLVFVLVLTTQSRGAMIAYGLVFLSYFFFILKSNRLKIYFLVLSISLSAIPLFLWGAYFDIFFDSMRARADIESSIGAGVGGGRIESWYYFFNNINYNPFFGVGYMLERDGSLYRPHSDLIRLNLSYGILILFFFLYMFRGFSKKYLMLFFAFLVPFLINTIIDDYRLIGIFIVFYSLIRAGNHAGYFDNKSVVSRL